MAGNGDNIIQPPQGVTTESSVIGCQTCNRPLILIDNPTGWRQVSECFMVCRPCLDAQVAEVEEELGPVHVSIVDPPEGGK